MASFSEITSGLNKGEEIIKDVTTGLSKLKKTRQPGFVAKNDPSNPFKVASKPEDSFLLKEEKAGTLPTTKSLIKATNIDTNVIHPQHIQTMSTLASNLGKLDKDGKPISPNAFKTVKTLLSDVYGIKNLHTDEQQALLPVATQIKDMQNLVYDITRMHNANPELTNREIGNKAYELFSSGSQLDVEEAITRHIPDTLTPGYVKTIGNKFPNLGKDDVYFIHRFLKDPKNAEIVKELSKTSIQVDGRMPALDNKLYSILNQARIGGSESVSAFKNSLTSGDMKRINTMSKLKNTTTSTDKLTDRSKVGSEAFKKQTIEKYKTSGRSENLTPDQVEELVTHTFNADMRKSQWGTNTQGEYTFRGSPVKSNLGGVVVGMANKLYGLDPKKGEMFMSLYKNWDGKLEDLYENIKGLKG